MRAIMGGVVVWLLLMSHVAARDLFVDNQTGDDRRNGRTPTSLGPASGPVRTIAKALRLAVGGDRIILANTGVPYRESITVQAGWNSGSGDLPFEIIGNGAVLDGTIPIDQQPWEYLGHDLFRYQPRLMSHQQLFLDEKPVARKPAPSATPPALQPLEWCLHRGFIYFRAEPNRLPANYPLRCCGLTVGITLYDVHDVIVSDLTVRGFQLDGVNAHDNVRRSDLLGLTCIANGRSGISVQNSSRVRIESCTARGNGVAQIRQEDFTIVQLIDNQLDTTSAPGFVHLGGQVRKE